MQDQILATEKTISLEQEKKQLLEKYGVEELKAYTDLVQESTHYILDECIVCNVSTRKDGSNG